MRNFRPFPMQLTCAPVLIWTSLTRRPISSDARKPVWAASVSKVVASPGPGRPVRCIEQRIEFRFNEESDKLSVETFSWNGKHALDYGGMLGMSKRCVPEQRPDGGEPSIAGAGTIFPLLLKVVEEGADERRIQIADVQLRRLDASPRRREDQ